MDMYLPKGATRSSAVKKRAADRTPEENEAYREMRRAQQREQKNGKYIPRSELPKKVLEEVRRAACERQKLYLQRQRVAQGLSPTGKRGRPKKEA